MPLDLRKAEQCPSQRQSILISMIFRQLSYDRVLLDRWRTLLILRHPLVCGTNCRTLLRVLTYRLLNVDQPWTVWTLFQTIWLAPWLCFSWWSWPLFLLPLACFSYRSLEIELLQEYPELDNWLGSQLPQIGFSLIHCQSRSSSYLPSRKYSEVLVMLGIHTQRHAVWTVISTSMYLGHFFMMWSDDQSESIGQRLA